MELYTTDPLTDTRWQKLSESHSNASIFHQRGWLEALRRTYGYLPMVLTSSPPGEAMNDGIVLCRISSWITGKRAVSLPFADHCEPLLGPSSQPSDFVRWLCGEVDRNGWKYVELRPRSWNYESAGLVRSESYCIHSLDLTQTLERIFQGFHKDSIQRRIQRAERAGLEYETGNSEELLTDFYHLLVLTRKRHGLLPQPRAWFRNLVECLGDRLQIRVARKGSKPIAAILTLRNRGVVVYKYGSSDEKFHYLGAIPFLFWKLIQESRETGGEELDFGRSDLDQESLISFKDRFGGRKGTLQYYRYPQGTKALNRDSKAIRTALSLVPAHLSPIAGKILYRHLG
jgi:hypothetical protein